MKHGICILSVIPGRKEPSDKSEMVTQILFGETFTIQEENERWIKIELTQDRYVCWICKKQYLPLTEEQFISINNKSIYQVTEIFSVIEHKNTGLHFPILAGSILPDYEEDNLEIVGHLFNYEGEVSRKDQPLDREKICNKSLEFLNAPYLWGGKTILGIDCSGLSQLIYKLNGKQIARDAYQQAEEGKTLSFLDEAQPGDLAFFDDEEGRIVHVGIILNNNQIIHASGKVRIDKIDHYGIFNNETGSYTHRLRLLKNYLS